MVNLSYSLLKIMIAGVKMMLVISYATDTLKLKLTLVKGCVLTTLSLIMCENDSRIEHNKNSVAYKNSFGSVTRRFIPHIPIPTARTITTAATKCILWCLRPSMDLKNMLTGMKNYKRVLISSTGSTAAGQNNKYAYNISIVLKSIFNHKTYPTKPITQLETSYSLSILKSSCNLLGACLGCASFSTRLTIKFRKMTAKTAANVKFSVLTTVDRKKNLSQNRLPTRTIVVSQVVNLSLICPPRQTST